MGITTTGLTKPYTAGADVTKRRILKIGAADGAVIMASASTDKLIGVSTDIDSSSGDRCDTFMAGNIVDVDFGGTIARGGPVTSDASGKAIAAAPSAGVNAYCIGFAEVSGVIGDVGTVIIQPFVLQG